LGARASALAWVAASAPASGGASVLAWVAARRAGVEAALAEASGLPAGVRGLVQGYEEPGAVEAVAGQVEDQAVGEETPAGEATREMISPTT
jgi:hypothetical protein